ncbi:hypothetical protein LSTR_LSTR010280 [Laodelphax striatellus]|uniref:Uncharacterized protein n=1 Tax=Laodelphax striatellus TaxID=195883 RepID=A0A482XRX9_LAOST|nr:hypothetical protein LSTR_LSTR010280 [Laodelphax striatellus]
MDKFKLDSKIITASNKCNSLKDIDSKEFQNINELWMYLKLVEEELDRKLIGSTNLNEQMQLLHDYNDMKDVTQSVFGRLATILDVSWRHDHCSTVSVLQMTIIQVRNTLLRWT